MDVRADSPERRAPKPLRADPVIGRETLAHELALLPAQVDDLASDEASGAGLP